MEPHYSGRDPTGPRHPDDNHNEPGATIMWYGMHRGKRLDQLDEGYMRILLKQYRDQVRNGTPTANSERFNNLHIQYIEWLDQRQSPLQTKIWFGKNKGIIGQKIETIYFDRTPNSDWHFLKQDPWFTADLEEIERRFLRYDALHPRPNTGYESRAGPSIIHPAGRLLGSQDTRDGGDDVYESDVAYYGNRGYDEAEYKPSCSQITAEYVSEEQEKDEVATLGNRTQSPAKKRCRPLGDMEPMMSAAGKLPSRDAQNVSQCATQKSSQESDAFVRRPRKKRRGLASRSSKKGKTVVSSQSSSNSKESSNAKDKRKTTMVIFSVTGNVEPGNSKPKISKTGSKGARARHSNPFQDMSSSNRYPFDNSTRTSSHTRSETVQKRSKKRKQTKSGPSPVEERVLSQRFSVSKPCSQTTASGKEIIVISSEDS